MEVFRILCSNLSLSGHYLNRKHLISRMPHGAVLYTVLEKWMSHSFFCTIRRPKTGHLGIWSRSVACQGPLSFSPSLHHSLHMPLCHNPNPAAWLYADDCDICWRTCNERLAAVRSISSTGCHISPRTSPVTTTTQNMKYHGSTLLLCQCCIARKWTKGMLDSC